MNELFSYCEEIQDLIACCEDWEELEVYVKVKTNGAYAWNLNGKNAVAIVTHDNIELL